MNEEYQFSKSASSLQNKLEELLREVRRFQAEKEVLESSLPPVSSGAAGDEDDDNNDDDKSSSYHKLALTHKHLDLKHSALNSLVSTAQKSSILNSLLNGGGGKKENEALIRDLDPEELKFLQELSGDLKISSLEVMKQQEKILESHLKLMNLKSGLVAGFSNSKELMDGIPKSKGKKKETLTKEEQKLAQIKMLIQNLMMATNETYNELNLNPDTKERHRKILVKCGLSPSELRQNIREFEDLIRQPTTDAATK